MVSSTLDSVTSPYMLAYLDGGYHIQKGPGLSWNFSGSNPINNIEVVGEGKLKQNIFLSMLIVSLSER